MITWITMLSTFVLQHMFCDEAFPRTKAMLALEQCRSNAEAMLAPGKGTFRHSYQTLCFSPFRPPSTPESSANYQSHSQPVARELRRRERTLVITEPSLR